MQELGYLHIVIKAADKTAKLQAQCFVYTPADATKKAVKIYVLTLFAAFVSVFIPLVHFVAVPGLLLLGPLCAFFVYRFYKGQEDLLVKGALCLNCQKELVLPKDRKAWPVKDSCPHCSQAYEALIEKSNSCF